MQRDDISSSQLLAMMPGSTRLSGAALSRFLKVQASTIAIEAVCEIAHVLELNPVAVAQLYLEDKICIYKCNNEKSSRERYKKWSEKRGYNENGIKTFPGSDRGPRRELDTDKTPKKLYSI